MHGHTMNADLMAGANTSTDTFSVIKANIEAERLRIEREQLRFNVRKFKHAFLVSGLAAIVSVIGAAYQWN